MGLHKKYEDNLNVVAENIKIIRNNKNMSLSTLSDKLMLIGIDISKQSLYRIEKNQRSVRDYELSAIAYILGIDVNDLLNDFIMKMKMN